MSFVVDCSVAARWFQVDEATPGTDAVFDRLDGREAMAPGKLLSEFANVFLKLARQRKLRRDLAQGALKRFSAIGSRVDRLTPEPKRLFVLAEQYGLSVYDATYLELALRLGVPLACYDGGLRTAAQEAGLYLSAE